jgi:beta-phosphoglucomutase-like phosphatase (HAD superfamily)
MNRNPKLFLFDVDGTLIRTGTTVHKDAFALAFRQVYGLELDLNGVSAAGRTDTWLLHEALRRQGWSDEQIRERRRQAFDLMEDYVDEHLGDLRDRVLPGVPEVLQALDARGQLLGLLTGNLARVAMAKVRHAGLDRYFDTGGFGEESEVRAHLVPVALRKAGELARHEIAPEHAVVIGDTPLDVEAGKMAGTRTVAVATGPYSYDVLLDSGADLVLPTLEDAVDKLLAISS